VKNLCSVVLLEENLVYKENTMRNTLDADIRNRITNNIRYLLDKENISQQKLAVEIDRSVSHVNALLNGHGTPTLELIINVCQYFNIKIDDLVNTDIFKEE
jgi:DNA-binding XRE family transcriptional regulator